MLFVPGSFKCSIGQLPLGSLVWIQILLGLDLFSSGILSDLETTMLHFENVSATAYSNSTDHSCQASKEFANQLLSNAMVSHTNACQSDDVWKLRVDFLPEDWESKRPRMHEKFGLSTNIVASPTKTYDARKRRMGFLQENWDSKRPRLHKKFGLGTQLSIRVQATSPSCGACDFGCTASALLLLHHIIFIQLL